MTKEEERLLYESRHLVWLSRLRVEQSKVSIEKTREQISKAQGSASGQKRMIEPENSETLLLALIQSQARFVIYSPAAGIISEHERASDAAVGFFQFAAKELQGTVIALPGIYKRTPEGWSKV